MFAKVLTELDGIARCAESVSATFPRQDIRKTCVLALFVRMRSCFNAARLLLRENHCDLVHTIAREFLEAYVDLINTAKLDFFHRYLLLRYYIQHRMYQKQGVDHIEMEDARMAADRYLRGNDAHRWVQETLAKGKVNLTDSDRWIDELKKELASLGAKERYSIRERFDMAEKTEMYKIEYGRLSDYVHNNLYSILEQFITEGSDGDLTVESHGRRIEPLFLAHLADCMADACRILAATFEQIDGGFADEVGKHRDEVRRIISKHVLGIEEG